MNPTNVVAAIIKNNDYYLLAKRNKDKYMGLKWEFPGGKVEDRETFKEALTREILEELNVNIDIHHKVAQESYQDDEINIILHYFMCSLLDEDFDLSDHEEKQWDKKQDIYKYQLVPREAENTLLI